MERSTGAADIIDTESGSEHPSRPARGSHGRHVRVRLPVAVALEGVETGALARELDCAGAFIESIDEPNDGARIEIILRYPIVQQALHLSTIVRVVTANGFCVRFNQLGPREARAIDALVAAFPARGERRPF
jgi:hypothetical protein